MKVRLVSMVRSRERERERGERVWVVTAHRGILDDCPHAPSERGGVYQTGFLKLTLSISATVRLASRNVESVDTAVGDSEADSLRG